MAVIESSGHFRISNDLAVHDEVRNQLADELLTIENWMPALLLDRVATRPQFDDQRIFIKLLVQPRPEFIQDRHGRTDNVFGYFFVEHEIINNRQLHK